MRKTYPIIITHSGSNSLEEYQLSLNFLYDNNIRLFKKFSYLKDLPSHVSYINESYDEWVNAIILYERGYGDCEDIACAIAAWLTVCCGVEARPYIYMVRENDYHVVIKTASGLLDPSKYLGMKTQ